MSDFYLSLPSHSSKKEFPDNSTNSFKIRLPHPIRLDGIGWKVGLASISLPDPRSQLPALFKNRYTILFKSFWISSNLLLVNKDNVVFTAQFEPRDIRAEDLPVLTGRDFMNMMRGFFDRKKIETVLHPGWKISEPDGSDQTHPHFLWKDDDFILHNDDVKLIKKNNEYYPRFQINADFAVAMGWFKKKGSQYVLGPNIAIEVPKGVIPSPVDTTDLAKGGNQYWRYYFDSPHGFISLTMTCTWRFINLNTAFKNVFGASKRSLFVYSDAGGSGVVGNQVTDLLREVDYRREGKGQQYFEPLHIQYIPVRKEVVDIIETEVAETTGELVEFGAGNTIVTLHFKKT